MRFQVFEVEGWPVRNRVGAGYVLPGLSVHVYDSAYGEVVRTWRSEDYRCARTWSRERRRATIRAEAAAEAARLEAEA